MFVAPYRLQAWLEARLNRVLPTLMAKYGVSMWTLSMRKYAEDPVLWSMCQRVEELGYQVWFQPSVDVSRQDDGRISGEGITGTVYTHPIGDHGHGAGP